MRVLIILLLLQITIVSLHISMSRHVTCVINRDSVMTVMGSGWKGNRQTETELQPTGVRRTEGTILSAIGLMEGLIRHPVSVAMEPRRPPRNVKSAMDRYYQIA